MLQVKNLCKVYNANGVEVNALDDVTLSFGDSGMCFILGKSGSGKSTLLNLCGGLDTPDSGEIIIKNRSSKDFTQRDFDSYRNTYVGFIFQEYNVLDEFTVEDNVMLALELQGRKKDNEVVDEILEKVDLGGLNKRRPNTLSGGQKQRVAIARALVKNPEIIMADEPSGALDSETGKQVFETLKKLSRDKLVLVVSHDREFAEKYADRIIELKDGKVISDVSKQDNAQQLDETIREVKPKTLIVRSGKKLTDKDIEKIRRIVENSSSDIIVTSEAKSVDKYNKHLKEEGVSDTDFSTTVQPQQRQYTDEESKFIRSTLPLKHAVRIGASGIKLKPVRFAFTLLLFTMSFVIFGVISCLMFYDVNTVSANSVYDYGWDYVGVEKAYDYTWASAYTPEGSNQTTKIPLNSTDVQLYKEKFGDDVVFVYNIPFTTIANLSVSSNVFSSAIDGWIDSSCNLEYIYGKAPVGNEIAISQYVYDSILAGLLFSANNEKIEINSYEDIVLLLGHDPLDLVEVRVSGVFKCDELYKDWLQNQSNEVKNYENELSSGFFRYFAFDVNSYDYFTETFSEYVLQIDYPEAEGAVAYLSDDEFGIRLEKVEKLLDNELYNIYGEKVTSAPQALAFSGYGYLQYVIFYCDNKLQERMETDSLLEEKYYSTAYDNIKYSDLRYILYDFEDEEAWLTNYKYFIDFVKQNAPDLLNTVESLTLNANGNPVSNGVVFTLNDDRAGIFLCKDAFYTYIEECKKMEDWSYKDTDYDYSNLKDIKHRSMFVKLDSRKASLDLIQNQTILQADNSHYIVQNSTLSNVEYICDMVLSLKNIFMWAGIVMGVFSMLLMFNLITVSINAKRKEIGILRALGASSSDVFKIFMSESLIIVTICAIVSSIVTGILSYTINHNIATDLKIPFSMFTFGIVQVLLIFAIAIVTAFISTFLPVYLNARKRPVEAIRQL